MQTTIVDLRYKMKDVLKALSRRERVQILYHGRVKGEIIPVSERLATRIEKHPFFGMHKDNSRPVAEVMNDLRKGRYNAF